MSAPTLKVFVSSTWLDLKPERAAVEKVIQRLRETKFVGMEYFGSREDTPRDVSLEEVDRSRVMSASWVDATAGRARRSGTGPFSLAGCDGEGFWPLALAGGWPTVCAKVGPGCHVAATASSSQSHSAANSLERHRQG